MIATQPRTLPGVLGAARLLLTEPPQNQAGAIVLDVTMGRLFWRWWEAQEAFDQINPRHPKLHAAERACAEAEWREDWLGLAWAWERWWRVVEELAR